MGVYLFLLFMFFMGSIILIALIAAKNKREDTYTDLEMDEWDCPECGFHIQAGHKCIYCDTEKPV